MSKDRNEIRRAQLDHMVNIPDKFRKYLNSGLGKDTITILLQY